MSEERVPYTLPDEMTQLRTENRQLSERLDAAFKTIDGFTDASSFQWGEYQRRIKELEQTVARQGADLRRLRHLDAMPLDALRRLIENCEWTLSEDYTAEQYVSDYGAAMAHFRTLDGDA